MFLTWRSIKRRKKEKKGRKKKRKEKEKRREEKEKKRPEERKGQRKEGEERKKRKENKERKKGKGEREKEKKEKKRRERKKRTNQDKPNQTNQNKPKQYKPNQTKPIQTKIKRCQIKPQLVPQKTPNFHLDIHDPLTWRSKKMKQNSPNQNNTCYWCAAKNPQFSHRHCNKRICNRMFCLLASGWSTAVAPLRASHTANLWPNHQPTTHEVQLIDRITTTGDIRCSGARHRRVMDGWTEREMAGAMDRGEMHMGHVMTILMSAAATSTHSLASLVLSSELPRQVAEAISARARRVQIRSKASARRSRRCRLSDIHIRITGHRTASW